MRGLDAERLGGHEDPSRAFLPPAAATASRPGIELAAVRSPRPWQPGGTAPPPTPVRTRARISGRSGVASSTDAHRLRPAAPAAMLHRRDALRIHRGVETRPAQHAHPQPGHAERQVRSRQSRASSGRQNGSRRSNWRASTPSASGRNRATVRVIGPAAATLANAPSGHCGTRPKVGFNPTSPHQAAGIPHRAAGIGPNMQRAETGRSRRALHRSRSRRWCARGFQGLRVMPCSGQSPGVFQPYSVVVVLPTITAPAFFSASHGGGVVRHRRRRR